MIVNETCLTRDQIAQAVLRAFPSLTHSMHAHSNAHMTDNTQQLCTKISPQSSMKQYRATTESPYPNARIMIWFSYTHSTEYTHVSPIPYLPVVGSTTEPVESRVEEEEHSYGEEGYTLI